MPPDSSTQSSILSYFLLGLVMTVGPVAIPVQAQVGLGIFGASVATEFTGVKSDEGRFGFEFGYIVGVQFDHYLNKDVTLSLSPTFKDERGSVSLLDDTDPEDTFFKDTFDISIKQLELPITFRVITNDQRWHFIGGMAPAFPLSLRSISEVDYNGDDLLRSFNLSFLTGVGFRFKKKTWGTLHLELRYGQSLTHLTKQNDPVLAQMKASHSGFTVVYFPPFLTP